MQHSSRGDHPNGHHRSTPGIEPAEQRWNNTIPAHSSLPSTNVRSTMTPAENNWGCRRRLLGTTARSPGRSSVRIEIDRSNRKQKERFDQQEKNQRNLKIKETWKGTAERICQHYHLAMICISWQHSFDWFDEFDFSVELDVDLHNTHYPGERQAPAAPNHNLE